MPNLFGILDSSLFIAGRSYLSLTMTLFFYAFRLWPLAISFKLQASGFKLFLKIFCLLTSVYLLLTND